MHQSLYRRYRPARFAEVRGQSQVVDPLRNAVAQNRWSHAYLFSGPRGTGKTSTARILAKALNCENLTDGEPCGVCESCRSIEAGTSYDLHELDAASNNRVENVRDLIERVALGSPGRTKVYILDEVHMLSAGASNALLKTLEEPPPHVVFVLATTDPQKVLPTIRSRTQHLEFHLLPAAELEAHVRWVIADAGLEVSDDEIEHVLRAGGGSARDTLSALEQVAAGGVADRGEHAEALVEALCEGDTGAALSAVAEAVAVGRDPRVLGESLLARLRDVFLQRMGGPLGHLPEGELERITGWAGRLSDRATTRALEEVGSALLEMRQAPDPRIPLEVALVRLTRVEAATGIEALVARVERLERALRTGAAPRPDTADCGRPSPLGGRGDRAEGDEPAPDPGSHAAPPGPILDQTPDPAPAAGAARRTASGPAPPGAPPPPPPRTARPASAARARLAAVKAPDARPPADTGAKPPSAAGAAPAPPPAATGASAKRASVSRREEPSPSAPSPAGSRTTSPGPAPAGAPPDLAALQAGWADGVLSRLRALTKAMYAAGQLVSVEGDEAVLALPNDVHRQRCEQQRPEVEAALAEQFGRPVRLRLVVDRAGANGGAESRGPEPDDDLDPSEVAALEDAPADDRSAADRLMQAFGGGDLAEEDPP